MDPLCYFCRAAADRSCPDCDKALCRRCSSLPHCELDCSTCAGRDSHTLLYSLHQVCGACIFSQVGQPLCVLWASGGSRDQAAHWVSLTLRLKYNLVFLPEAASPSELLEEVSHAVANQTNKGKTWFLLVSTRAFAAVAGVINLMKLYRASFLLSEHDMAELKVLRPRPQPDQLLVFFEEHAAQGQILLFEAQVAEGLCRRLGQACTHGALREVRVGPASAYCLVQARLSSPLLSWVVTALTRLGVVPLVSRIQDVLEHVFAVPSSKETVLALFQSLPEPKFCFNDDNSHDVGEVACAFKRKSEFSHVSVRSRAAAAFAASVDCRQLPAGIYLKWLLHRKQQHLSAAEAYCVIELATVQVAAQTVSEASLQILLVKLVRRNPDITFTALEEYVTAAVYPRHVQVSVREYLANCPLFVLDQGVVRLSEENECPVCMEPLATELFELTCKHVFHMVCIQDVFRHWHRTEALIRCPTCTRVAAQSDVSALIRT